MVLNFFDIGPGNDLWSVPRQQYRLAQRLPNVDTVT